MSSWFSHHLLIDDQGLHLSINWKKKYIESSFGLCNNLRYTLPIENSLIWVDFPILCFFSRWWSWIPLFDLMNYKSTLILVPYVVLVFSSSFNWWSRTPLVQKLKKADVFRIDLVFSVSYVFDVKARLPLFLIKQLVTNDDIIIGLWVCDFFFLQMMILGSPYWYSENKIPSEFVVCLNF